MQSLNDYSSFIQYNEQGFVPVIVQDNNTLEVLMLAYANKAAVMLTKRTGYAHYFSRSRNKIWKKGEESGHVQGIIDIRIDCDEDTLLYLVEQTGVSCHTGHKSCFYRDIMGIEKEPVLIDPDVIYK
jgi:phosphoribosyl-AMP cyclohydrolase